jgi:DNA-binding beta-propeller fold protein YncE
MNPRTGLAALTVAALLAACGGSGSHKSRRPPPAEVASIKPAAAPVATRTGRSVKPPLFALVTAETENRLLVVDLPSGRVTRRIAVAPDPEDLATDGSGGVVAVVSSAAGKVTLLAGTTFRPFKVFGGFGSPHIATIAPDDQHVYVTDDARGTVTDINLFTLRRTSTIVVGAGAHHLSFDPWQNEAWVALGESATTIVILDASNLDQPRVTGRFEPGFPVHDVEFAPDARQAWLTSATGPDVTVFNPADRHVLFRVPVGPGPQHVAFDGRYAYLTSGYGSTIEQVDAATGRVLKRAGAPYGSFELSAADGYVVTSSLLRGTLAIYTPGLKLLRIVRLAPATREVAISSPT